MNKSPILSFALVLVAILTPVADAQVVIRKSSQINIEVERFGGANGSQAAALVQQDLRSTPGFKLARIAGSTWIAKGGISGNALNGSLVSPDGHVRFSRRYSAGTLAGAAHLFSRDIILEITGKLGLPGSKIVFSGSRGKGREIFICDHHGENLRALTADNSLAVSPSISPDGGTLAYTSYRSGYPDVWGMNLRTGTRSRLFSSPGTNTGSAISPDGSKVALTMSFSGNPELYVGSIGGGKAKALTKTMQVESSPTWSPDGRKIAYNAGTGSNPQLMIISSSGGNPSTLKTGYAYNTEPDWSPDGQRLAFNVRSGGNIRVAIYEFSSGKTTVLSDGESPVWGPDSRHLIYTQSGNVYLLDTETGSAKAIVTGMRAKEPSWTKR